MIKKNADKLKRKQERETFVGFRPSVIDHKKIYNRKAKQSVSRDLEARVLKALSCEKAY